VAQSRSRSHFQQRRQQQTHLFPVRPLPLVSPELIQLQVALQIGHADPPVGQQELLQQPDLARGGVLRNAVSAVS
jgi:hypothetical protein